MTQDQPTQRQLRYPPKIWSQALYIAKKLGETEASPRFQIASIIQVCGADFAQQILDQTWEIQAQGGLLVPDGNRKRTRGGVFFYLAREQMNEEQRQVVFIPQYVRQRAERFRWSERATLIQPLLAEPGEVTAITVMAIGHLVEIAEHLDGATFRLKDETPRSPTPTGVPQLQGGLPDCVIHIGTDLWLKLKPVLDQETPQLTIEGLCAFDPAIGDVVVYELEVRIGGKNK